VLKKVSIFLLVIFSASVVLAGSTDKIVKKVENMIKEGNLQGAEGLIDSCLEVTPDDFKLLRAKAKILFLQENYKSALDYYEKALIGKSKDPDALYGAGICALKLDLAQKALEYFERGIKTKKRKGDFYYGLGLAQMELGSLVEADLTMRKAIKEDKNNPLFHRALGDINFKKDVWSIAISEYRTSLELDSTQADLYYKLAKANFFSRNFTESVKEYKIYLKKYPIDTTAWEELAKICEASNKPSEASFCYQKLTELKPEDGDTWFTYGKNEFNLFNYEVASEALEKAVSLGAHVAESYKMLAKIYQFRKEYFKADSAYSRFEQELGPPEEPQYWLDKGKVMLKIGEKDASFFSRAVESFDTALKLDSTNSVTWEYAGLARYYKKDYKSAIPFFKKKIELGGPNVNALRNLAYCYLKTEKYDLAASTLEQAIVLKPEDVIMRQTIGKIYSFIGNCEKAIEHYKVALKDTTCSLSNIDKCKILGDVCFCYNVMRDCGNAITYGERAIKCDPKNIDYLYNLATAYHLCNKIKLANTYYKKVLEIDPKHKGAREGAARTEVR